MPAVHTLSRRHVLRMLAGVPLLPIGGAGLSGLLAACGDDAALPVGGAQATAARFVPMAAPNLDAPAAMATTSVASQLQVDFSDGSQQTFDLAYQPFFVTGTSVPANGGGSVIAGGYYDIHGAPILDNSVPGQTRQFFSDCPDGMSLLTLPEANVSGVAGNPVFAVVQFEYTSRNQAGDSQYGRLPSPIAVLTLDQDPATGHLELVRYAVVDTAPANGLWITCGASLSPWGTHLASEEYEPDAATIDTNDQFRAFITHLHGNAAALDDPQKANPYLYGHLPEVTVHTDGSGSVVKHYCLGRLSHELVQVMPDRRTVLMGDDYTNGGLFLFVADQAEDLSAGTLYAARWNQTSGNGPGAATLDWIRLGHATSAEVLGFAQSAAAAGGTSSLMDVRSSDPGDASFTRIRYSGRDNWVKPVPGQERAAAFLETHRYAALRGASLGFTKMEGTTVNVADKVAYSAMSSITKSMTDGSTDIRVQGPKSGAVYALKLRSGRSDTDGAAIDSEWVPIDMAPVPALIGEDLASADALGNLANPDRIANPDNIKFSEQLRTLFIGEDSGMHVNNFLWAYNVDTGTLARILSCPAGAESTGLQGVDGLNGWTYVTSNFQHPGDWESPLHDQVRDTLDPLIKSNYQNGYGAAVGYITGIPRQVV